MISMKARKLEGSPSQIAEPPMSALGHKRTFAVQNVMSALPPKADILVPSAMSFVPIADMARFIRREVRLSGDQQASWGRAHYF